MTSQASSKTIQSKPFMLGEWLVDPDALQLHRDDQVVVVQAKAMRLLLVLAQHAGEVVRKEALLDSVWDHRYVVEGVLKRSISDLRKALGDDPSSPTYIETIPKRGYRLIGRIDREKLTKAASLDEDLEPYPGLETFDFKQAKLFFGREVACAEICQSLKDKETSGHAFVLVLGMSGVGKSSLVRAGVLPNLLRAEVDRRAVFCHSDTPGDVFDGLAVALLRSSALPSLYEEEFGQAELAAELREQPQNALSRICAQIQSEREDAKLYLVIDQMEELFAFKRVDHQERKAFFAVLKLMAASNSICLIATLRSDFYHRFCESADLRELKSNGGQYDLVPPSAAEIRSIVRKPAELAGLTFEIDNENGSSLDEVIADAAIQHPEALPLLQFVLHELFKRRDKNGCMTFDAYRQLGGVEGCLGQRAEETYKAQSPDTRKALPHVLGSLVTAVQEHSIAFSLRPALRSVLVIDRHSEYLVDALTNARLLTTHLTHDGENRVVRVAHEALFVHWNRSRRWLQENISSVRTHRRLAESAHSWKHEGKRNDLLIPKGWQLRQAEALIDGTVVLSESESDYLKLSRRQADKKSTMARAIVASVSALVLIALGSLYVARKNNQMATAERERAEQESLIAQRTISLLSHMFELSDPATRRSQNITPKEMLDEGAERVMREFSDNPLIQATLLHTIGVVYNKRGLYPEARNTLQITVTQLSQTLGESHPLVADALTDLANTYHHLGEFDEAVSVNQRALDLRRQSYGDHHRKLAESLHQKGWILHSLGETASAEEFVREGLAMQTQLQNEGVVKLQLDLATSHKSLGVFLLQRGALQEAEPQLLTALNIRRTQLGNDHPDVGMSLNHLSGLYTNMQKYNQAKLYSEEALQLNRKLLGDEHPDVALSYYNLASVLYRLGDYDVAAEYAQSCIDINTNALGEEHGIVAISKGFLSSIRVAQSMPNEALKLLSESSNVLETILPEDHWRIAWLSAMRGAALADLGQEVQAERLLLSAYAAMSISRGADDETTIRVREYVEKLYDPATRAADYQRVQEQMRIATITHEEK